MKRVLTLATFIRNPVLLFCGGLCKLNVIYIADG
jgi:hypothetical protein